MNKMSNKIWDNTVFDMKITSDQLSHNFDSTTLNITDQFNGNMNIKSS